LHVVVDGPESCRAHDRPGGAGMIWVAWRILWRQPGTLVGALVMTVLGAALLSAFMVLHDSIAKTRAPVERYADADVVVAGEDGVLTTEQISSKIGRAHV